MITDKPLAWTVEIGPVSCVVFAPTRAKAKWVAISAYWVDIVRCKGTFPKVKAYRASCYDNSRLRDEKHKAWDENYVMDTMNP